MRKKIIVIFLLCFFMLFMISPVFAEETTTVTNTVTTSTYEGTHIISSLVGVFNGITLFIYIIFAFIVAAPVIGFGVVSLVYALLASPYKNGKDKVYVVLKGVSGILMGLGAIYPVFYFNKIIAASFIILFVIGLLMVTILEVLTDKKLGIVILGAFTIGFTLLNGILFMASIINDASIYVIPLLPVIVSIPLAILNYMVIKKKRFE